MSPATRPSPNLPRTEDLPRPATRAFRVVRPGVAAAARAWYDVEVLDQSQLPTAGPVVLAANHVGVLDGPLLAAVTRRSSYALVKKEMYGGFVGWLLTQFGQIAVDRHAVDPTAIRRSIRVLRDGGVLVVFPEGMRSSGEVRWARPGAVYLAMVTGAPIVPVALLGTREPGASTGQLPPRGSTVRVVYGEPLAVPQLPWPRPKALVAEHTERLRRRLADHVVEAQRRTGLTLPGPPAPSAGARPSSRAGRSRST
ncbi:MAG TPA: lysophospholipid acyltransferase family protein [Microlunatus sp.]|nr:lysophospholipid acyltransferase family protein [Microlunatus sp.]